MIVSRFRRGLKYWEQRRFDLPLGEVPASMCALILRPLSNSHTDVVEAPEGTYHFCMRMLAALTARNVSVGEFWLKAFEENMSDYRSMDTVFGSGGLRMSVLNLSMGDSDSARLIKTTDFLRTPTVQGLSALTLMVRFQDSFRAV